MNLTTNTGAAMTKKTPPVDFLVEVEGAELKLELSGKNNLAVINVLDKGSYFLHQLSHLAEDYMIREAERRKDEAFIRYCFTGSFD